MTPHRLRPCLTRTLSLCPAVLNVAPRSECATITRRSEPLSAASEVHRLGLQRVLFKYRALDGLEPRNEQGNSALQGSSVISSSQRASDPPRCAALRRTRVQNLYCRNIRWQRLILRTNRFTYCGRRRRQSVVEPRAQGWGGDGWRASARTDRNALRFMILRSSKIASAAAIFLCAAHLAVGMHESERETILATHTAANMRQNTVPAGVRAWGLFIPQHNAHQPDGSPNGLAGNSKPPKPNPAAPRAGHT